MRALVIQDYVVVGSTLGRTYLNEYSYRSLDNYFIVVYAERVCIYNAPTKYR